MVYAVNYRVAAFFWFDLQPRIDRRVDCWMAQALLPGGEVHQLVGAEDKKNKD
jgi:hypothetical protein